MKKEDKQLLRNHTNPSFKKYIIGGVLVIFIIFIIGLFYSFVKFSGFYNKISTNNNSGRLTKKIDDNIYTFLIMGYGGAGHQGAYLTDTMMVGYIDINTKKILMINLPRDIWVQVPTKSKYQFYSKVNSVYQMGLFGKNYPDVPDKYKSQQGSAELIKEVVGKIVGFDIDYYAAVDFAGFVKAVDMLGGVNIYVDRSFTDEQYPLAGKEDDLCGKDESELEDLEKIATESPEVAFPCRYETIHFDAGNNYMDGETALKYVRSRHSKQDGGDFSRARRQKSFLLALKDKLLTVNIIPKIFPLLDQLDDHIKTDIPIKTGEKLLKEAPHAGLYNVSQILLTTDNLLVESRSVDGQYILVPKKGISNWSEIQKLIKNTLASPSAEIK